MEHVHRSTAEDKAEIWLVLGIGVGWLIAKSIAYVVLHGIEPVPVTPARFAGLLAFEILLIAAFVPLLRARGWTLARATRPWQFRDLLRGAALFVIVYAVYYLTIWVLYAINPRLEASVTHRVWTGTVPWFLAIPGSIVNPIYEEFLYLGYGLTALRRYGVVFAAVMAIAMRIAIHIYQGWAALLYIAPIGILFTLYYLRTNRLWPVIVAHALADAIAVASLVHAH